MAARPLLMTLVAVALATLAPEGARAATFTVDDDGLDCAAADYTEVSAAVQAASAGDNIVICPGVYSQQVVVDKKLLLRGQRVGSRGPVLRPTALPASRPSVLGSRHVTAGLIVDGASVTINSLDFDLSGSGVSTCEPLLAGIYVRNGSAVVSDGRIVGVRVLASPVCDTGVGIYAESGPTGEVRFGRPVIGKAKLTLSGLRFSDCQKSGVVANGLNAKIKMRGGEVVGNGLAAGTVQNGVQLGMGARGRVGDVLLSDFRSAIGGKTATGVLLYRAGSAMVRGVTINDSQTGVFVVGKGRVIRSELTNLDDDGIVLLGDSSFLSGNKIDTAGVSGVFVNGQGNRVRFGVLANMPIGLWFYGGDHHLFNGLEFINVPQQVVGVASPVRDLTEASTAPLLTSCRTAADCDDGSSCTLDLCDPFTTLCVHTSTCDDGNGCTDDACTPSGCTFTNNTASCSDGSACTVNDTCAAGSCQRGAPIVCDDSDTCTIDACSPLLGCVQLSACNDRNPCTLDACDDVNGCSNTVVTDGTPCPDNNPCDGEEICQGGVCGAGVPPNCDDGNLCTHDTCTLPGGCAHIQLTNNTPCPNGDVCDGAETCQAATCRPGTALNCNDGNACTTDTCNAVSGCVHTPVPGCINCSGDAQCNDSNPCTTDTCSGGACQNTTVTDGTACPDGDLCNGGETCQAGSCTAGTPPNCDDGNVCTDDSCDSGTGCQHPAVPDGSSCADGTVCNGDETCQGGSCASGTALDCDDGNPCTTDGCLPVSGCEHTALPNDSSCSDGDACNGAETCQAGSCTAGTAPNCDDGNVCTADSCDPGAGCQNPALSNGTACADGDVCNGDETCQGGTCTPGAPLNCDDGDGCTADACNALLGCTHTPIGGCRSCSVPADCADGDPCTADVCGAGGVCQNPGQPDGTACPDGDACNGDETCTGGVCMPGTAPNCDDSNQCTTDACLPASGCESTPVTDGTPCADSTVCNGDETCQSGTCTPGAPLNCNDGNVCTLDTCHDVSGCQQTARPDGTSCADSTVCNGAETCQSGACTAGIPLDCDDGNACTLDSCLPLAGCQHVPIVPCP
jgi:hypothetical protein